MECPFAEITTYIHGIPALVDKDLGKCPFACELCYDGTMDCWHSPEKQVRQKPDRKTAGRACEQLEKDRKYEVHAVLVPVAEGVTGEGELGRSDGLARNGVAPDSPRAVNEHEIAGTLEFSEHDKGFLGRVPEDDYVSFLELAEELRIIVPRLDGTQKRTLNLVESNKRVLSVHTSLLGVLIALVVALIVSQILLGAAL